MKKLSLGLIVAGLVVLLVARDAWARGPRSGFRGGARPSTSRPGPGSRPASPPTPSRHGTNFHSPDLPDALGGTAVQGVRPQSEGTVRQGVHDFLGVDTGRIDAQHAVQDWIGSNPQPFTAEWYLDHPNAWKATHPYAGPATAAVTTAAVATWFATVPAYAGGTTTVVAGEEMDVSDPSSDVSYEDPADSPANAPTDTRQWMPIGIFAIMPEGQANATRMIQLAVARDGSLRGSHYDVLSEEVAEVRGTVDKEQLEATWRIGQAQTIAFTAPLDALTGPDGMVTVHLPNGGTTAWRTVRIEQPQP